MRKQKKKKILEIKSTRHPKFQPNASLYMSLHHLLGFVHHDAPARSAHPN